MIYNRLPYVLFMDRVPLDRDMNAAINILKLAITIHWHSKP